MEKRESKPKQVKHKGAPKEPARKARSPRKPRSPSGPAPAGPGAAELHRLVAERAYFLFLDRGCEHGHDLGDWFTAEAAVLKELR